MDYTYCCPGCGAAYTSRELGRPELDHRHERRCPVRWRNAGCAWHWPYPVSFYLAFAPGEMNSIEQILRRGQPLPPLPLKYAGSIHRVACEAQARYLPGVAR